MGESGATSNAGAVKAKLEAFVQSINFTTAGGQQSLGKDCLAAVAVGIRERTVDKQEQPSGQPLAPNRGKYRDKKARRGLPIGVGLRKGGRGDTGRMLSLVEVEGRQTIEPEVATMTFGKDDQSMQVAGWFTVGSHPHSGIRPSGAKNQPPRPFYAMDDALRAMVLDKCREFIADMIKRAGYGTKGGGSTTRARDVRGRFVKGG
jgi:hypothetical protein